LRQRHRNDDSNEQRGGAKAAAQSSPPNRFQIYVAIKRRARRMGLPGLLESFDSCFYVGYPIVGDIDRYEVRLGLLDSCDVRVDGDCPNVWDIDRSDRLRLGFMVAGVAARSDALASLGIACITPCNAVLLLPARGHPHLPDTP
jgi:hypothetical protein